MTIKKQNIAQAIIGTVVSLATPADTASDLEKEYFDAGTFEESDMPNVELTPADLAACITLLQQFEKFMSGEEVAPADYRSTLNKVRRL